MFQFCDIFDTYNLYKEQIIQTRPLPVCMHPHVCMCVCVSTTKDADQKHNPTIYWSVFTKFTFYITHTYICVCDKRGVRAWFVSPTIPSTFCQHLTCVMSTTLVCCKRLGCVCACNQARFGTRLLRNKHERYCEVLCTRIYTIRGGCIRKDIAMFKEGVWYIIVETLQTKWSI